MARPAANTLLLCGYSHPQRPNEQSARAKCQKCRHTDRGPQRASSSMTGTKRERPIVEESEGRSRSRSEEVQQSLARRVL